MKLKKLAKKIFELSGYSAYRIKPENYSQDGLHTRHNHEFMSDPDFCKAYARGVKACEEDYSWHWRVHVGLWAARTASSLNGDFVECGVNRGFLSSAIMEYLDWSSLGKTFYLLDTFSGIDEEFISDEEREKGIIDRNKRYSECLDLVKENFSEWDNVRIVAGSIPNTLDQVDSDAIAYLHLDMNCSPPEVAAFNHFWDRLLPGAIILLDDYGFSSFESQKVGMDAATAEKNVGILSLPTGQGLIIKPS